MKFGIGTAQFIENYGILKTNTGKTQTRSSSANAIFITLFCVAK